MTDDKPWYGSRTILANAIGGAAAVAAIFGLDLTPDVQAQIATLIMVMTNLANIGLRLITSKPIRSGKKPTGMAAKAHPLSLGVLLAVLLTLGACGQLRPTTMDAGESPQQTIFAATADYGALLSIAESYESLPRCAPNATPLDNCSRPSVVETIRAVDNDAFAILSEAQRVVRSETGDKSALDRWADRASGAVAALRQVLRNHDLIEEG